ncbi:sulfur carrier protein ThiS [Bifidobacterium sp. 64T4]|uniref:sulfur carrier protein ThiS n=1 Tax=Bifidobacterium pongonis TaxID=2834432 RepID=UPI001C574C4C|nr:sulfur carrier protein ThiS [Bifidobacterium pongonis]MBW3095639.1 sulfur carrier protein ThiS [Bifidobacterium pongonis]
MIINGKEENVETPISVAELIERQGFRADRVAVELNGEIVPRTKRAQTQLKGTDTVEIVTFVQGG